MENEQEARKERVHPLLEEETKSICDGPCCLVEPWKLAEGMTGMTLEGDEILQTKTIGAKQVVNEWKMWPLTVEAEAASLLHEKEALQRLNKEQYNDLKRRAAAEVRHVEELPSKMVWTLTPDANAPKVGRRKAQWVICGNYEEDSRQWWRRRDGVQNYDQEGGHDGMGWINAGRQNRILECRA